MMAPGESRRFWIPAELAFGSNESAAWSSSSAVSRSSNTFFPLQVTTKPTGPLVFDVELYSIERTEPLPCVEAVLAQLFTKKGSSSDALGGSPSHLLSWEPGFSNCPIHTPSHPCAQRLRLQAAPSDAVGIPAGLADKLEHPGFA